MSIACVALVDDEAPVRVALGRLLRLADFSVLAFASGEQFLASLAARVPDCVLLDLHLPGLTGLEVQVRLRDAGLQLPVVFISASDSGGRWAAGRRGPAERRRGRGGAGSAAAGAPAASD